VHGGPERALHHYAADNYPVLAAAFPELESQLVAGSLGENLSSLGLTEETACIGDTFRLGGARIQVSQPRSPCWKIDCKFGATGLSRFIAERGLAGWYYRVLQAGDLRTGDALELIERNPEPISLRRLWQAHVAHRPEADELAACAATPGLTAGWVRKLSERLDWLRRNPELDLRRKEPL
jgi:MOSC domain-containing protein YiiM